MITAIEEETKKSTRQKQYVWEAWWSWLGEPQPQSRRRNDQEVRVVLFSAPDIRRARVKAEAHQKERRFDGDLVGIVRSEDIIL